MKIPQPFLQTNSVCESHMQFRFNDSLHPETFFHDLGNIWNSDVLGIDDPSLYRSHEYGAGTGSVVIGFRPEFWRRFGHGGIPENLNSFTEDIVGINGMRAPAMQLDFWIWLNQHDQSTLFDAQQKMLKILEPHATLENEQSCFTYHNNITFDGFADGVGNPNIFRSNDVTLIPDEQPGAGGTTLLVQKWIIQIDEMKKLGVGEAEKVYGRTKLGSHELSPQSDTSHVARNQFYDTAGNTIDIVRRNAYFASLKEAGVIFVGLSNNIDITLGMLKQMYGVGPDGIEKTDRLLDYATAVSSANYFIPSITDMLAVGIKPKDED